VVDGKGFPLTDAAVTLPPVPISLKRHGFAALVTATALLLTLGLSPLKEYFVFDIFLGAVFLSSWYGGFGPGLLAMLLSCLAMNFFVMAPHNAFSVLPADFGRLVVFGAVGGMTSLLSAKLREARAQLQDANETLERRLRERTEEVLTISNREQQRLGQDLHDGLCQTLTGVRFLADALRVKLSAAGGAGAAEIEKILARLGEVQAQAESVSRGLYPVELETDGLMSALRELAEGVSRTHPVACRFTCRRSILIQDHGTAVHIYRITLEAVMNAVKHGKARRIEARLWTLGGAQLLTVADDGVGISSSSGRKGMGMRIMAHRARAIGTGLRVRPRRPKGTLVACLFHAERPGRIES
jgi:signal transduction histidine kinase